MLPVYYDPDGIQEFEVTRAKRTWDMIMNDTSPIYKDQQSDPMFAQNYVTCFDWYFRASNNKPNYLPSFN